MSSKKPNYEKFVKTRLNKSKFSTQINNYYNNENYGTLENNNFENNLLYYVCIHNKLEMLQYLIDRGSNINEHFIDENGRTPLIAASGKGHIKIVELLIENHVEIDALDNDGHNALWHALNNNHLQVAKLLILNGISINKEIFKNENFRNKLLSEVSYRTQPNTKISNSIMNKLTNYYLNQYREQERKEENNKIFKNPK